MFQKHWKEAGRVLRGVALCLWPVIADFLRQHFWSVLEMGHWAVWSDCTNCVLPVAKWEALLQEEVPSVMSILK